MNKIPFVNLERQYQKIKQEIHSKINEVIESRAFIQGKYVEAFEEAFADAHNARFAVGCSNGTSAISLALEALGVSKGDEVIVPANTFFATAEAVCNVGAVPVFIDIDPDTYCIFVNQIESLITPKTKAVIPVHLYGNPCDMDPINAIAKKHNLWVVEDCAQAHLAKYKNEYVGSFGDMATFSFYPGKNLGAYGDAGMIFCKTEEHAAILKKLRNHGRSQKYEHDMIGYNHRMDGIQAAILQVKLKYLGEWTKKRQENAKTYNELLSNFRAMIPTAQSEPVYHLFVIQTEQRNEVANKLKESNIASGIHYPIPLHLQPAFKDLNYTVGDFPNSEYASERIISLPFCSEITKEEIESVCHCLTT